jgi:AcrR family transcriptional regulator
MYDAAMSLAAQSSTPRPSDLTRQRLIGAAFGEIHRHGFRAASLARILADAGLTKGALYHHFPDKHALGLAVVDEAIRPMLSGLMLDPVRSAERPLAAMIGLIDAKLREPEPWAVTLGCPLNNLMQEMSPVDEAFRVRLNALFRDWVDAVADGLMRGQAAGEVREDIEPRDSALFIVSALEGCIGASKNMQSTAAYRGCLTQLRRFLETLRRDV